MVRIRERRYAGLPACIRFNLFNERDCGRATRETAKWGKGRRGGLEERYTVERP